MEAKEAVKLHESVRSMSMVYDKLRELILDGKEEPYDIHNLDSIQIEMLNKKGYTVWKHPAIPSCHKVRIYPQVSEDPNPRITEI